jgi:hypothetical protein
MSAGAGGPHSPKNGAPERDPENQWFSGKLRDQIIS